MKTALIGAVLALGLATISAPAMAKNKCLDIQAVADADVQRNAALIASQKKLCISVIDSPEKDLPWKFVVITNNKKKRGPTIFLVHDNEQAAFDTALYSVMKYGGKLVAVEAGENRHFRKQDPNRNFATTPETAAPCRDMRTKPAPIFTKALWDFRSRNDDLILTLHNNANGHVGNGGGGAISAERTSAVMKGMPAPNGGGDEDDAVLLAGTAPFELNEDAQKMTAYLHENGVNVIYEYVRSEKNDCSFSNYVVLNTQRLYLNIEAQHGHVEAQKRMLDVLYAYKSLTIRAIH